MMACFDASRSGAGGRRLLGFLLLVLSSCASDNGNRGAGSAGAAGTTGAAGAAGSAGASGAPPTMVAAGVRWMGRADVNAPDGPVFAWSGSGFAAIVEGTRISVNLRSDLGADPIYFQPVVDGTPLARFSVATSEGAKTVTLASDLEAGDHAVELYRETEGKLGYATSTFLGFVDGTPKDPPAFGGRLIEIVGDSISAGYGNLGSEEHPNYGADPSGGCRFSTETESAYLTYGAVAARALGADASIVAASGWGIHSDNSGNTANVVPRIYSNAVGGRPMPAWDFAIEPQAVIVNLGTNDFSADPNLGSAEFSEPYVAFLATLRAAYPNAWIYCAIGPLLFDAGLTNAREYINAIVTSANGAGDAKVKVLDFGQQNILLGTGCDYHPNATEHQRMADRLVTVLRADLGW